MGRGRGQRARISGGVAPRGISARPGLSSPLSSRSPLDASQVREWAEELRSGEADDLVDTLLSASGHARPAREQMRLAGTMLGGAHADVRTGATQVALGDDYAAAMEWTLTSDGEGVSLSLDAVVSRGQHRLGVFDVEVARPWSAENDELLVVSDALRHLGRQLEAR